MIKKLFNKFLIKDKVAKAELTRAHGIIILLSISLMMTLTISSSLKIHFDPLLSFVSVVLLAIVAAFSLSVVLSLKRKK